MKKLLTKSRAYISRLNPKRKIRGNSEEKSIVLLGFSLPNSSTLVRSFDDGSTHTNAKVRMRRRLAEGSFISRIGVSSLPTRVLS